MKKMFSLIRACMSSDMSLFRYKSKNKNAKQRRMTPIFIAIFFMLCMGFYAESFYQVFDQYGAGKSMVVIFAFVTILLTLIEGVYKAGTLLFNCKDDDLLLSLPIKKSTVLFIRIFKFYVFEFFYNALFLLPALVVYAMHANVTTTYYLVAITGLILLPVIPIIISSIIGIFTTKTASRFKHKSIVETVIAMSFALVMIFVSFNMQTYMAKIGENANAFNDKVYTLYYPIKVFIELLVNFNIVQYLIAVGVNIALFALIVIIFKNVYFKINSKVKEHNPSNNKEYKVVTRKQMNSLIHKEFKRFFSSSVFITNAAFGLVLFIIVCVAVVIKYDDIIKMINDSISQKTENPITIDQVKLYLPLIMAAWISMSTFMSSITSSMISLEGKKFSILKSLPVKPYTIIKSKILMTVILMLPILLLGTIMVSLRCGFSVIDTVLLCGICIALTFVAETYGIICNLKFPKMDAENDTEVVKQSTSSFVAVMGGMFLVTVNGGILIALAVLGLNISIILGIFLAFYAIVYLLMKLYLNTKGTKIFNKIQA